MSSPAVSQAGSRGAFAAGPPVRFCLGETLKPLENPAPPGWPGDFVVPAGPPSERIVKVNRRNAPT